MFEQEFRLLTLIERVGKLTCRKKLQKIVHLLKHKGAPFHFNYRYHHYGPYSTQLQAEMDYLVENDLIAEEMVQGAYTYSLTEDGKKLLHFLEKERNMSLYLNDTLLDKLLTKSSSFLELVSTYVFLLEIGYSPSEARQKTVELKPDLVSHLDEALSFYEEINHVE